MRLLKVNIFPEGGHIPDVKGGVLLPLVVQPFIQVDLDPESQKGRYHHLQDALASPVLF